MTIARRSGWIIELDYTADPDTHEDTVFDSIEDQLAFAKGTPRWLSDEAIVFDDLDDALWVKMRFPENIVSLQKIVSLND